MAADGDTSLDLGYFEELAEQAVVWYTEEKARLVKSISTETKPFSKPLDGFSEYQQLASQDWGSVVSERGLDQAKKMARRFFTLAQRYGSADEMPPADLQDEHVSPHPMDSSVLP